MGQTITHSVFLDFDNYGKPTYAVGVPYSARVNYRQIKVKSFAGEEAVADGEIWVLGSPVINPEDKITLPDGSSPALVAASRPSDESDVHHTKVFFSKRS